MNQFQLKFFKPFCLILILSLGFQLTAFAQGDASKKKDQKSLTGVWDITIESDRGDRNGSLVFRTSESSYTGYIETETGTESELKNILLKNDSVAFDLSVERDGQVIQFEFDTTISGQLMNGNWRAMLNQAEVATGTVTGTRQLELSDFRGYTTDKIGPGWSMKDGILHFDGNKCGDLVTKKEYGDFVLKFDWKISEAGNSGVMYRVSLGDKKPYLSGPEYQILDDDKHKDGKLESHRAGALYALYVPNDKTLNAVGEWNSSKIVLKGNSVQHWLNGKKIVDAELGSKDWNKRVNASKFKNWGKFGKNKKGHVCFQDHGDPVWYRNIIIEPIN